MNNYVLISVSSYLFLIATMQGKLPEINLQDSIKSLEIHVGQQFKIASRLALPLGTSYDFQWDKQNRWQLESYSPKEFTLLKSDSTAPDWFGGDLFQWWIFKANSAGDYTFIFTKGDKQMSIEITVKSYSFIQSIMNLLKGTS